QAGHQRRRKLPLPDRVDPHARGSGNPQGDDGRGRLRAGDLRQHDRRHRRPAPRHQALMLTLALLAAVESGLNRVLRMDATALPRLTSLAGKVIAIECRDLPLQLFLLADREGLRLAGEWQAALDCRLRASSTQLLRLGLSHKQTRELHDPDVEPFADAY